MNSWDSKIIHGAERLVCVDCSAHVLALPGRAAVCGCCGGFDLRRVTDDRRPAARGRFARLTLVGR